MKRVYAVPVYRFYGEARVIANDEEQAIRIAENRLEEEFDESFNSASILVQEGSVVDITADFDADEMVEMEKHQNEIVAKHWKGEI